MRYALRNTWICQRGKSPEAMAGFKPVAENYRGMGLPTRLYVDISGDMDVIVLEIEIDSLDEYFKDQRAVYAGMDDATKGLINGVNENTSSGSRALYEIIEF